MRRQFLVFLLFLSFDNLLLAQEDNAWLDAKIDSAWNMLSIGSDLVGARRIASELFDYAETYDSYRARVNANQIMGESYYFTANQDSALVWYHRAYELSIDEGDRSEQSYGAVSIGTVLGENAHYDSALVWFDIALGIREDMQDTNNIVFILNQRAWLNNHADRHDDAMADYVVALDLATAYSDSTQMAAVLNGIAIVHKKQANYEDAIRAFQRSADIADALNDPYGVAAAKGNLAMTYKSMGAYSEAYSVFPDLLEFYYQVNYDTGKMSCFGNMGIISNLLGEHSRAISELRNGIALADLTGRSSSKADFTNELGKAYLALGQLDSALHYSLMSQALADQSLPIEKKRDAALALSDIYAARGEYANALDSYKAYTAWNDSIFNAERSNEVLALQAKYDAIERERDIERLEAENKLADVKRNRLIMIFVIVSVLFAIIIIREIGRRRKAKALHDARMELAEAENARLEDQIAFKNRELTSKALHLAQKNELLTSLREELKVLEEKHEASKAGELVRVIDFDDQIDKNWEQFTQAFTETNEGFFRSITDRYGDLSKSELRLAALLKMNLGSKEIAMILNISEEGVKKARYRLRKKLNLDSQESLESVILSII